MRIAVIGSGIAGSSAAWALSEQHQVTVYERESRLGGHTHTVDIDYDGQPISVDTGFIVYNEHNYPELTALFAHHAVETLESDMSFSVSADGGKFEWSGRGRTLLETLDGVFAQRRNILRPSHFWMLREMSRFNRESVVDLKRGLLTDRSLGQYLTHRRYSDRLVNDYLVPMGAAIWSTPVDRMLDFPAENFVAFFDNHRLLHVERPVWRTVRGGSRNYVEKLAQHFRTRLRLDTGVANIARSRNGVTITDDKGHTDTFDQIVIAAHSDQALAMLSDASDSERDILGAVRYLPNDVYLHSDARLMPKRKRAWSSWNFLRGEGRGEAGDDVAVTYWMNALQHIDPNKPLFVSLNPPHEPAPEMTFARFTCHHPQFDAGAFAAQAKLDTIQGVRRTWFCGAWTGYGFHEDGLRSGLDVAQSLGATIPWRSAPLAQAAE
jgi:predicted NAD/FAD-binding protein